MTTRAHDGTKERWGDLSERATKRLREHPIQMHPLELSALSQHETRDPRQQHDRAASRWRD